MSRVLELENLLLKAKQAYYFGGQPIISDEAYDVLEDELRGLKPDSDVLALVGAPVPPDGILQKAQHRMPMGSQSKVNSVEEFATWYEKSAEGGALQASLKGDGASAAAYYKGGRLFQVISRGNGLEGEDITANAMKFQGLPVVAYDSDGKPFDGAVRVEVILTVEDWAKIDPERSKNPRNAGSGIMGRKNGHQSQFLSAFAFDIEPEQPEQPVQTESQKIQRLLDLGFTVVPGRSCSSVEEAAAYFEEVTRDREALPFWIDGVVFKLDSLARQAELGSTAGRPKGQIAWKFDSKGAETVLRDYSVNVGHTGALIPTAHLDPVEIGGTTVRNALLNNWDEIARLDVEVGDRVWLIKANDIIPKVIARRAKGKGRRPIALPTECPACQGPVARRKTTSGEEGAIIECTNDECPARATGKLKRWIKSLDIEGIGDVVRTALVEQMDARDPSALYGLKHRAEELADLVINAEADLHLGQKRATTILESLESTRQLTLIQFLGSLGVEKLAQRRVQLMIEQARGELDTLDQWRSGRLGSDAEFAASVGVPNVGAGLAESLAALAPVIDGLLAAGVEITGPGVDHSAAEARQTVCISGKLPSGKKKGAYEAPLAAAGYELVSSVTKDLGLLVVADPSADSSKAVKARKYGVRVIDEAELEALLQA